MAEKLIKSWNADPNGEITINVYRELGIRSTIRGILEPTKVIDVPSGVVVGLYEAAPLKVRANQRVEKVQGKEVTTIS